MSLRLDLVSSQPQARMEKSNKHINGTNKRTNPPVRSTIKKYMQLQKGLFQVYFPCKHSQR
eukprot:m.107203 g.107203  ORF g.107203 m.107203 type:complete len:61 (+) comp12686_c1_seq1:1214-1396(+)